MVAKEMRIDYRECCNIFNMVQTRGVNKFVLMFCSVVTTVITCRGADPTNIPHIDRSRNIGRRGYTDGGKDPVIVHTHSMLSSPGTRSPLGQEQITAPLLDLGRNSDDEANISERSDDLLLPPTERRRYVTLLTDHCSLSAGSARFRVL
eukprot:3574004-Pyramimonas_sp.AAC.1